MYQKAVTFTNEMADALFVHGDPEAMIEFNEIQTALFKFINKTDWNVKKNIVTIPYRERDLENLRLAGYTDVTYDNETESISCKTENGTLVTFGPTKTIMQP